MPTNLSITSLPATLVTCPLKHVTHVSLACDPHSLCQRKDDEMACEVTKSCPDRCVCYGKTFSDKWLFHADTFPSIRYLEGRGSGLTLTTITNQTMLIYLGAGACGWTGPNFMKEMDNLQQLIADNFKLCCPAVLPDEFMGKCIVPADEISSCDNLLKAGSYRAALAIFAMSALLGNMCSFVYRLWFSSAKLKVGHAVFVIHLCLSDFFMGVYLLIIGLADHVYAGDYLWKESYWKRSTVCSISGFLSLLSCEVSSILICLITLDRFLVICFPFSRLRFGSTSAHVACTVSWGLGMVLASVPLLPVTSHWGFYSQTGLCIPLPVTRTDFPGRHYSFAVMIVFNFVLFVLISVGQALIYWSVRANTMSDGGAKSKDNVVTKDKTRSKEATVARRLLIIAMSDFLCWFPIGVCGLLAKLDLPVPGEVNTAMAVFVLPFNSALNPFLYTYTILREKRRKENKRTKMPATTESPSPSADRACKAAIFMCVGDTPVTDSGNSQAQGKLRVPKTTAEAGEGGLRESKTTLTPGERAGLVGTLFGAHELVREKKT
ncbi:relaxin receptor 2-like [Babylonia areolata]|uniref:relaxin receptor 2-like n=1 Tax=Babylonia areolata TaxID=304850 RepID=UPI003FD139D3